MSDNTRHDDELFVNLILIFQSAALQQMGKTINPLTSKVERDLRQARFSIDTLAMLKEKTRGNLSEDLERLLESVLLQLRMNYVEEVAADETAAKERSEAGPPSAERAAEPSAEPAAGPVGAEPPSAEPSQGRDEPGKSSDQGSDEGERKSGKGRDRRKGKAG